MQELQERWVRSLGQEDTLEEEMATHSSILPMDKGAWWAIIHGVTELDTTEHFDIHSEYCIWP